MKKFTKERIISIIKAIVDNDTLTIAGKIDSLQTLESSAEFTKKYIKYVESAKHSIMYSNVLLLLPIKKVS